MTDLRAWLQQRAEIDRHLYEQYGKPLEQTHSGRYIAIGPDGQTILGESLAAVLEQAIAVFGSGNFALKRIGHRAGGRWLGLSA